MHEDTMREDAGYRFGPLERRGLLLGLGLGQLAALSVSLVAAIALAKTWPNAGGFLAAGGTLGVGGLLCRPVAGKPPSQWLGVAASFGSRRRALAERPPPVAPGPALRLPARTFASGLHLCELPAANGQPPIGTLLDERSGTAAALLRAKGGPFCFLDDKEKEHWLAAWAGVLESVSAQRSSLVRLQWCQRALPADSGPLLAHLRSAGDAASPGFDGHARLLEGAGQRAWRHETLLVISVRCRSQRRRRRPSPEGAEALRNEVRALRAQMRSAGFVCEGVLDAAGAATTLGNFLIPSLSRNPGAFPWPLALQEHWSEVRADSSWHRTYWVAEWPRSRVGPDFLSPLLVGTGRRCFSVVMAPVAPEKAAREAESSRTAQAADAQLRAQGGFLQTARQRRQSEALEGRETELADGRGAFELAGYITVSAADKPALEEAAAELERAAGAAKLCLRPLYGQQKEALTWTLPFGRGV
jgi:hypothetical protein